LIRALLLAAALVLAPVAAAALHIVSGLIVVFNSARLVRCGEEIEQAEAAKAAETGRAG
jgi:cation transport ATPase